MPARLTSSTELTAAGPPAAPPSCRRYSVARSRTSSSLSASARCSSVTTRGRSDSTAAPNAASDETAAARTVAFSRMMRPLLAQYVQYLRAEVAELAVLDELTQVAQAGLLGIGDLLAQHQDALHDGALVLKAALVTQHVAQERHERA
eukprot:18357-Chlamydomonas_euryale.AAC.1